MSDEIAAETRVGSSVRPQMLWTGSGRDGYELSNR
jgi:hypothetical protein